MIVLITGSNGFVGSRLMYELETLGHKVFGIDISAHCDDKPHINTAIGDIRIMDDLMKVRNSILNTTQHDIELIIHCAAAKHDFGVTREQYYSHNETGTRVLLDFTKKMGINKFLYFSTVSVFGHPSKRTDERGTYNPDHPYGGSKLAGELLCLEWQKVNPLAELIVLRPTVIYGPHNYANMYKMIDMMHRRPFVTIGEGDYIKSIVSLSNVIDMTLFSLTKLSIGVIDFNCVDQPYITVHKLMEIIARNPSFRIPKLKIPLSFAIFIGRIFDIPAKLFKIDLPVNSDRMMKFATATDFDSGKIRKEGYVQKHTIEEEITRMTDWYLSLKH